MIAQIEVAGPLKNKTAIDAWWSRSMSGAKPIV
jgi:hypothetical protein